MFNKSHLDICVVTREHFITIKISPRGEPGQRRHRRQLLPVPFWRRPCDLRYNNSITNTNSGVWANCLRAQRCRNFYNVIFTTEEEKKIFRRQLGLLHSSLSPLQRFEQARVRPY